jgi:DNA-binding IclR family transcriptional regulator
MERSGGILIRLELKILTALSAQRMDAEEIAEKLSLRRRSVESALRYMENVGLLAADDDGKWAPLKYS